MYLCSGSRNGARGTTSQFTAWGVLLSILLAEHFYLAVQQAVRYVMGKVESPGLQRERKERYLMKKKLLQENLGEDAAEKASAPGVETTEKITRATLEEEARQASVRGQGTAEEMYVSLGSLGRPCADILVCRFWQRQRGMQETILIGRKLIAQVSCLRRACAPCRGGHGVRVLADVKCQGYV